MIEIIQHGNFKKANGYLERLLETAKFGWLDKYGRKGVEALKAASPEDTGLMASSWYYQIEHTKNGAVLSWCNNDIENGTNVAILVQYGHATKNGRWVNGRDYINVALQPIYEEIDAEIRKEVARR